PSGVVPPPPGGDQVMRSDDHLEAMILHLLSQTCGGLVQPLRSVHVSLSGGYHSGYYERLGEARWVIERTVDALAFGEIARHRPRIGAIGSENREFTVRLRLDHAIGQCFGQRQRLLRPRTQWFNVLLIVQDATQVQEGGEQSVLIAQFTIES